MNKKTICFFIFFAVGLFLVRLEAYAGLLLPCKCELEPNCGCTIESTVPPIIEDNHRQGRIEIKQFIREEFNDYRDWLVGWDVERGTLRGQSIGDSFFEDQFLDDLMAMATQMGKVAYQQSFVIGTLLDAKEQLETQKDFQEMEYQSYQSYVPSRNFCWYGTNVRSLAHSEQRGLLNLRAMGTRHLERQLGSVSTAGAESADIDSASRWARFREVYCVVQNNDWIWPGEQAAAGEDTGLEYVCNNAKSGERSNIDVDYTRLIEDRRTLDINFLEVDVVDGVEQASADEEDVMALSNNLYGHELLPRLNPEYLKMTEGQELYLAFRTVIARRALAQNSFNKIASLKSAGTTNVAGTQEYLGAVLSELGVPDDEVLSMIGDDPSLYAQLEILAKKIYQNTDFYTDLYDTPANIARKEAALKAIGLMLDRQIYKSELRQELMTSVLLASKSRNSFSTIRSKNSGGD